MHELTLGYAAPIPVGHRVNVVYLEIWVSTLFSTQPASWQRTGSPIVVDLDTSIIYCDGAQARIVIMNPFNIKPNMGHRIAQVTEARVASCMVATSGGEHATITTRLELDSVPSAYR
jgi:hypothetical protein